MNLQNNELETGRTQIVNNYWIFCGLSKSGITTLVSLINGLQYQPRNENKSLKVETIIDLPGFLCGNNDQEITNYSKSITTLTLNLYRSRNNLVIFIYPATEIRIEGDQSLIRKCFRILKSLNIVKECGRKNCGNLILVLTKPNHVSSNTLKFVKQGLQEAYNLEFGIKNSNDLNSTLPIELYVEDQSADGGSANQLYIKLSEIFQQYSLSLQDQFNKLQSSNNNDFILTPNDDYKAEDYLESKNILKKLNIITYAVDKYNFQKIGSWYNVKCKKNNDQKYQQQQDLSQPTTNSDIIITKNDQKIADFTNHDLIETEIFDQVYLIPACIDVKYPRKKVEYVGVEKIQENIYKYKFQIPILQFDMNDIDSCISEDFITKLQAITTTTPQTEDGFARFFDTNGTHLIYREINGVIVEVTTNWQPRLLSYYEEQYRKKVANELQNYLENLLVASIYTDLELSHQVEACNWKISVGKFEKFEDITLQELGTLRNWRKHLTLLPTTESHLYPYYNLLPVSSQISLRNAIKLYEVLEFDKSFKFFDPRTWLKLV